MNYIVIDLEFNQCYNFSDGNITVNEPRCPFEIIQIGAVKMNKDFEITETADFLIKPVIYGRMHPYVQDMTGISMDILENESGFVDAYESFIKFLDNKKSVLCVWGSSDLKALFRNIEYHELDGDVLTKEYIDVQVLASSYLDRPLGIPIGLKNAVLELNLNSDMSFHNAYYDALYTAQIFQRVKTEDIGIKIFKLMPYRLRGDDMETI